MSRTVTTSIALLVLVGSVSEAQLRARGRRAVQQGLIQEAPQVPVAEWATKLVKAKSVDFGVIATGSDSKKFITVRNVLDEQVVIQSATTTCGCSVATPSKKVLDPGEEAQIEITMNTRRFKRRKDSNVLITFSRPSFTTLRIPITAYIRTDVVFDPGMVQFGSVEVGKGAERQIKIAYAGRPDWVIKSLKVDNPHLAAKFTEKQRSGGRIDYVLDVYLKASAPIGRIRDLITLVTDDSKNPFVPLLVEGSVEADITATPEIVSLGRIAPGSEHNARVVVKSRSREKFEIESVQSVNEVDGFQYRRPRNVAQVLVIPFTVKAPEQAGRFEEEFLIRIVGRKDPVRFRVTGEITTRLGARQ